MLKEGFPEATIVITGTAKEKKEVDCIAAQIEGAVSLAGQTSLRELLTLYASSDMLVTNDSGPGHFSSLTPIKSIILFGPETPFLYGQSDINKEIIAPRLVCSPCVNVFNQRLSPCKRAACLKDVSAGEVYEKIRVLLESDAGTPFHSAVYSKNT